MSCIQLSLTNSTSQRWEEKGNNNAVVRTYTWGLDIRESSQGAGGVAGLLMVNAGSGGIHFPAYDLNGNVMGLVKAANGTISTRYEYGPFGEVFCSVGELAGENPFQFSTKYTDFETDLVYYGYRYYSPDLGRWISRDPIEEQGGFNLYAFVNNDPVNKFNILGLDFSTYSGLGYGYSGYSKDCLKSCEQVGDKRDMIFTNEVFRSNSNMEKIKIYSKSLSFMISYIPYNIPAGSYKLTLSKFFEEDGNFINILDDLEKIQNGNYIINTTIKYKECVERNNNRLGIFSFLKRCCCLRHWEEKTSTRRCFPATSMEEAIDTNFGAGLYTGRNPNFFNISNITSSTIERCYMEHLDELENYEDDNLF